MSWGLAQGKAGVGMGFPRSLAPLPHCQGPGLPSGSSLRNRTMSADGKVFWKQSVLCMLIPSFPSSCEQGLRETVSLERSRFCMCNC